MSRTYRSKREDLADAAAMQSDLCGYLAERQPAPLRLGERLAACESRGLGFAS